MAQRYLNNFDTQFIAAVKNAPTTGSPSTELDYGILRVTLSAATQLGTLSGGDYYILTAYKKSGTVESNVEILKVTAIDTSVINETRLTVSRGQEGTSAQAYVPGDYVSLRFTKGSADSMLQKASNLADLASASTARSNLGLGTAALENTTAFTPAAHATDTANPHAVTKAQIGLGSAEDKSSSTIRSEITSTNVTTALGYTPLSPANNLSDLVNTGTARTNLGIGNVENKSSATIRSEITSTNVTTALTFTPENAANKGAANGYAPLGSDTKIASTYLPSYVDDVLEYANFAALPGTGESGKIYVLVTPYTSGGITSSQFRWSGSAYAAIIASPGSTDAVTEGATNLYFTTARARSALSASGSIAYNGTTGVFSYTAPTVLSAFTNDSGYATSSAIAAAYLALSGGTLTGALVGTSVTAKKNVLTPVALTSSGGSIAIDLSDSNFTHTLTENTVLANPTNLTPGQSGRIKFTNHASSPKTLAFGSYWLPVGGVVQSLTASNSAVDLLVYEVDSATTITFKLLKDRK